MRVRVLRPVVFNLYWAILIVVVVVVVGATA